MLTIAVDAGFGKTKGCSNNGKTVEFPSVIGELHPVTFTSGLENDSIVNLAIGYNQRRYFIGEAALKQTKPQATVDKDRTVSEEGLVLLMGALALLVDDKVSDSINLVVGLPVMHYESLKEKYISVVKQIHLIERLALTGELLGRRYISISAVKVLPQPMGTLFNTLLKENGDVANSNLSSQKVGIIDIGYNTLDLAWVDNLQFLSPRSTSFSGLGMFSAYQNLAKELYHQLGIEILPENISSLLQKGEVKIAGRSVSIEPYKRKAFEEAAKQIISRVKSTWPTRWDLDQIIISGGGAVLLGNYLIPEFQQAIIAPNPMFANASGYLKFGTRTWKQ